MYVISDRFCSYKKGELGGDGQVYVGGHIQDIPCTWWMPWLAVECPWSALTGLTLLVRRNQSFFLDYCVLQVLVYSIMNHIVPFELAINLFHRIFTIALISSTII